MIRKTIWIFFVLASFQMTLYALMSSRNVKNWLFLTKNLILLIFQLLHLIILLKNAICLHFSLVFLFRSRPKNPSIFSKSNSFPTKKSHFTHTSVDFKPTFSCFNFCFNSCYDVIRIMQSKMFFYTYCLCMHPLKNLD